MRRLIYAFQFLTILPLGTKSEISKDELAQSAVYFPVVGLVLGLILSLVNTLLLLAPIDEFLVNVILVILLIILTGGLHLDGLADTFDALLSGKDKDQMLNIMRDAHIGTMGVLSLISGVLLKWSLLCSLSLVVKNASLILICLLSRYSLVWTIFLFPYAREQGKAKVFVDGRSNRTFLLASIITLCCAIIAWWWKGLLVFITVIAFTFLLGRFITKKFGGITGDTLGATNELVEIFVLINILILSAILR